ncbi:MCE family protein [bacterium]|nr:MCE family protein [bacterium]
MARSTVVRHETAVGAFVTLVCVILAGLLIVKGTRVGFGSRHVTFRDDAGHDLKQGAAVRMNGIEIGEVSDVSLDKDNSVLVSLKVFPDFRDQVRDGSRAVIVEPPLFGSTAVEITSGTGAAVKEGATLEREHREGLVAKVQSSANDLQKVVDRVNKVADRAEDLLVTVNAMTKKINDGHGLAARLMNDEALADEVSGTLKNVRLLLEDVNAGKGAYAVLKDPSLAPDFRAVVADVRSMTDAIARGDGSIGRIMTNPTFAQETEGVLHDVRGALGRLEAITKDTQNTTEKVQQVLDAARGTLEKLDGTIKNTEKITNDLAQVTDKINKGNGTLAKLVNDDALYRETKALLKELRESVEDLREQAPINSFIGVVFSAF